MTRNNRNADAINRQLEIDNFLSRFLTSALGKQDVRSRLLHWIEVANAPTLHTPSTDLKAIAEVRRKARQNVRRLITRHPVIATEVYSSHQPVSR